MTDEPRLDTHPPSLACAGLCPEHGTLVVPLGMCWHCLNPVTGPDPWALRDAIERGIGDDTLTPGPGGVWVQRGPRRRPDGRPYVVFPLDAPPVAEGWHWKPAVFELQVHARCEWAWMNTPRRWCPDCFEDITIGDDDTAPLPIYCEHCEMKTAEPDEDGDEDDDDPEHVEAS